MYCIVALSCLVAAVLAAPAPQPTPVANPQFFLSPWSPIQPSAVQFYPVEVLGPRPRAWSFPSIAFVASQGPSAALIPQSVVSPDEVKASHERIKRDLETELTSSHDVDPVAASENTETHKVPIQKRQAAYFQMPWTMPFLSAVPISYAWSHQSYNSPSGSSSWSVVTL